MGLKKVKKYFGKCKLSRKINMVLHVKHAMKTWHETGRAQFVFSFSLSAQRSADNKSECTTYTLHKTTFQTRE